MSHLCPTPTANVCPHCDNRGLTLATDMTEYAPVTIDESGKWHRGETNNTQADGGDNSIRLFCENCGTYFEVPENLEY